MLDKHCLKWTRCFFTDCVKGAISCVYYTYKGWPDWGPSYLIRSGTGVSSRPQVAMQRAKTKSGLQAGFFWLKQLKKKLLLFLNLFIYLFLAVLGLRFCARAFSSCGERGPLFIAVRGPLTIAASLVAEHRLQTRRLSNCGSRAQLLRSMWDLPRPGLEPVSPALAGRLSTTAPPRKPPQQKKFFNSCQL